MNLNYDKESDVLCITFKETSSSYGEETIPGIVVLRDYYTNETTGYTILDCVKTYGSSVVINLLELLDPEYAEINHEIKALERNLLNDLYPKEESN